MPQAAGGQVVRPFQLEELALAHVAVAVAAWRGERDRPPDLYQPGGETRESPPCQVLAGRSGAGRAAGRESGSPDELRPVFPFSCAFHLSLLTHAFVHRVIHSFTRHSLSSPCQVSARDKPSHCLGELRTARADAKPRGNSSGGERCRPGRWGKQGFVGKGHNVRKSLKAKACRGLGGRRASWSSEAGPGSRPGEELLSPAATGTM